MDESRRSMLLGFSGFALGALVLPACHSPRQQVVSARRVAYATGSQTARASDAHSGYAPPPSAPEAATCGLTEANIEGPYYRTGAPIRSSLSGQADGVPLELRGRVLSADCSSPLSGAVVDVWHADSKGHYDNDRSGAMSGQGFHFRGVIVADARGEYSVKTIVPGRYLNGRQYRPAHLHVKLSAAGHAPLTTQLYFPGDPFNDVDPFIKQSLVMEVEGKDAKRGQFDFVLSPSA